MRPDGARTAAAGAAAAPQLRIDKLLWYLRLAASRSAAQALAETGHVRLNGRRVERAHTAVRAGDVLTLPWGGHARIVRVAALPRRRGPPAEARALYEEIAAGSSGAM